MPEEEKEMRTFEVNYLCDECGEPVTFTGVMLASNPPQYPHVCKACGWGGKFRKHYPHTRLKPK